MDDYYNRRVPVLFKDSQYSELLIATEKTGSASVSSFIRQSAMKRVYEVLDK